ncbi:MAG: helix-turn-helix transcriptional regulator [Phycisphaeraceae bacterium]|nr:helix-turn-helix transcriptional regulator [Phycisphaeraceae bacterium]
MTAQSTILPSSTLSADAEMDVPQPVAVLRLLADPSRVRVLNLLREGERNVSRICDHVRLSQPTVSHHLGLLRGAGLLCSRREGKEIRYSLNPEHAAVCPDTGGVRVVFDDLEVRLPASGIVDEPAADALVATM